MTVEVTLVDAVPTDADPDTAPVLADDAVSCGPIWVSPGEMCEARAGGERVALSGARLRLLATLLRARGKVVTRDELYREARGGDLPGRSRAIDVHIARIRKALGPFGRAIVSVPGIGYRIDVIELQRAGSS